MLLTALEQFEYQALHVQIGCYLLHWRNLKTQAQHKRRMLKRYQPKCYHQLSHHPYILCHFAAAYTNMLCVFVSCVQRVVEGNMVGSAGSACWCAWGGGYVVGGCNEEQQGLKYLFLTLPNIDSGCTLPEVHAGNMEKFCAFTMAWKLFRYISEVSHKHNNHMIISTNLGTTSALVFIFKIHF